MHGYAKDIFKRGKIQKITEFMLLSIKCVIMFKYQLFAQNETLLEGIEKGS